MEYRIVPIEVDESKIYCFFEQIQDEIKYKNRFQNEKLDEIVDYLLHSKSNISFIRKGTTLYRARIYKEHNCREKFLSNTEGAFRGYDKENSFVNKNFDSVFEGRCNPKWIPYLYVSKSEKCCIHEVRPRINDYVNVAKIKILSSLKIINLSCSASWYEKNDFKEIIPNIPNTVLFIFLGNLFSTPYQNENDYLITQYISEKIKNLGYDGIAYKSSVYNGKNDVNLVIFNYNKCDAISSELYKITALDIKYQKNKNNQPKLET